MARSKGAFSRPRAGLVTATLAWSAVVVWSSPAASLQGAAAQSVRAAYVAVTGVNEHPFRDIQKDDLIIEVEGRPASVLSVQPADESIDAVFVVDTLPSDTSATLAAMDVFAEALRSTAAASSIALTRLETSPVQFVGITDADAMRELKRQLLTPGTPLMPGLLDAVEALGRRQSSRRIVLAIAALGRGTHGVTAGTAAKAFRDAHASLWGIEIGPLTAGRTVGATTTIDRVSRLTGGYGTQIADSVSLRTAMERMANVLLSQYRVTYSVPAGTPNGTLRVGVTRPAEMVLAPVWSR